MTAELLTDLRRDGARGLQRRLYDALVDAIRTGRLPPGARLPPTRQLAQEQGISRHTVVLVYERLLSEGYLAGRVGAGTFVAPDLRGPSTETKDERPKTDGRREGTRPPSSVRSLPLSAAKGPWSGGEPQAGLAPPLSRWASRALAAPLPASEVQAISWRPRFDFRPGVPDWETFPHTRWRRLLARRWRSATASNELGQYGDPAGYRPLREALAGFLIRSRGLRCTADQVVIATGSQQALDLLTRVCLNAGDVAAVEQPGYPPARAIFTAAGAGIEPLSVDEHGLLHAALAALPAARTPRLIYVTPSHQYPTGVTLALGRRLELIDWAAGHQSLIVEDDYASELRYAGPPLPALQGLDERGCVVYVGSCSTVLFPPLRVGWIVAPPTLVPALVAAKWLTDRQTSTLDQQVLADFIAAGDFTRHLRRSRSLYGARRAALVAAVQRHLPPGCAIGGDPAGLDAPLGLPPGADEAAVVEAAAARGVAVSPLAPCYGPTPPDAQSTDPRPGLLLGFAAVPEPAFDDGIRRLRAAIEACLAPPLHSDLA